MMPDRGYPISGWRREGSLRTRATWFGFARIEELWECEDGQRQWRRVSSMSRTVMHGGDSIDLPLIGLIAKLELKPDDVVILQTDRPVTTEQRQRMQDYFKAQAAIPNTVVVLDALEIKVLSPTDVGAS